ncbi:MAG: N-acetyltransferase, partial [Rhodospirillaceae bacterium]
MSIIAEQPAHAAAIETILDLAFGVKRTAKTVYRLRVNVPPIAELSFVNARADEVFATIRYWPVSITNGETALLLGPIAVARHRHGEGLGAALIDHSLSRAALLGHSAVLLVGDAPY